MSSLTDALYRDLHCDLAHHMDPYQLASSAAGATIWPDATRREASCFALSGSLFKKFNEASEPSAKACSNALEKFLWANKRSSEYKLELGDTQDEELLGGIKAELYNFWNVEGYSLVTGYEELVARGGTGPGASLKARGTDFYTKVWDSPLSTTREHLLDIWEKTVSVNDSWRYALTSCLKNHNPVLVEGNKLGFVNKNVTVARCISTEPTINMWLQLGFGRMLVERLTSFYGINLENQQGINRALAQTGSEWGLYSTIDLESASDTISCKLLEEILPRPFYNWLMELRSPVVRLPNGDSLELGMIGTMGNGFTFPLQTVIFSAVVATVYKRLGIKLRRHGSADQRSFGVFGDDIIVHRNATRLTYRLLGMLGFIVNQRKSFVEGPFRESCGGDYFNGHPIRGVYIKRLKLSQDFYVAINSLNRWSSVSGVPLPTLIGRLVRELKKRLGKRRLNYVPPDENDDAGLHVPLDMARGIVHLQHGLVGYYRDVVVAKTLAIKGRTIVCEQAEEKRRNFNPSGLWLTFLQGSIRDYHISLRQRNVWYTTSPRQTPMWNSLASRCPTTERWLSWSRWSAAASFNLTEGSEVSGA